jgi:hypothetical protein
MSDDVSVSKFDIIIGETKFKISKIQNSLNIINKELINLNKLCDDVRN